MKKLMTVMASAATALFAIGAVNGDEAPLNATSFEDLDLNTQLNTLAGDDGQTMADKYYWYMASTDADNGTLVTNDVAGSGVSRPDYFAQTTNEKALSLDTSSPLFRHMGSTSSGSLPTTGTAIGDGIYLDTLVKFTAADDVFGEDALEKDVDKIAISYVEQGDDIENPITNFVIRAGGLVNEEFGVVNYIAHLADGSTFDKDQWHRLTVRAIANVGDGQAGFIVYLDGNPDKFLAYDASINAGFTEVLPMYADKYYNSTVHAIYPSAVNVGDNKTTITAASFSGTGAIDDVVFTAVKPEFIQEQAIVTIAWDTGFTAVTIDNVAVTDQELAAGKKDVQLNGTVVSVSYTLASGYEEGTFTGGTWESGSSEGSGSFTGLKSGDTCTLVSMQPKFDVGGVRYESLEDALDAAIYAGTAQSPATLKLLANCAECITLAEGYVIIDLAGHDIQGSDEDSFSINCKDGANVVVTNSIPSTGAVKLSLIEDAAVAMNVKGDATRVSVYDTKFEGSIKVDAADETALLKIFSGTFIDDNAEGVVENFKYTKYIQNSAKVTYLGSDYFQVGEGGEQSTGYDSGDGEHTFTIAADREAALTSALPEGKTLASKVSESSDLTYAQAYALGLWSENSATVADLDATISVGADGKVTVSLANVPTTGYSVTCKVYEKASLTADWPDEAKATYAYGSEQAFTPGSATAGFYKVEVVIANAPQQ